MNETNSPNGFGTGDPDPLDSDWSAGEKKIARGNLGAIAQSGVKRMLAYSSIAHAGASVTPRYTFSGSCRC